MNTREPKMTQSTNGQICLGLVFEEDAEFPWDEHNRWDDIDDWWLSYVLKWLPTNELYDKDGEYIGGVRPPQESIDRYYKEKREFVEKAPKLPVKLVSGHILAVPSTFRYANSLEVDSFRTTDTHSWDESCRIYRQEIDALFEFCGKYKIETHGIGML